MADLSDFEACIGQLEMVCPRCGAVMIWEPLEGELVGEARPVAALVSSCRCDD